MNTVESFSKNIFKPSSAPRGAQVCSLRTSVVDEIWERHEPGRKPDVKQADEHTIQYVKGKVIRRGKAD